MQQNSQLPNFIIGGFPKSGTSSLYSYFAQHPQACGCAKKEPKYFLPLLYDAELEDLQTYKDLYSHCDPDSIIRFEASSKYVYGGTKVAEGIKRIIGSDVKFLFVIREPFAHYLSIFKYKKYTLSVPNETNLYDYTKNSLEQGSQEILTTTDKFNSVLDHNKYAYYLKQWFDVWGEDHVRVVFFDDLKREPVGLLENIAEWLGIDKEPFRSINLNPDNVSTNVKNRGLHKMARFAFHGFEQFWRKNPKLKNFIRDSYHKLNAEKHMDIMDDKTKGLLSEKYDQERSKLKELLISHGYSNFPSWL